MKKKILSLLTAFAMVFGILVAPFTSAKASESEAGSTEANPKNITVNVHKVLMSKEQLDAHDVTKDYDQFNGVDVKTFFKNAKGDTAKEIDKVYFIAFKSTDPEYNNFNEKTYTDWTAKENKKEAGLTGTNGLALTLSSPGKYKIYEVKSKSTYQGDDKEILAEQKAVPVELTLPDMVTNENGIQDAIHVYPKNTQDKPVVDKFVKQKGGAQKDEKKEQSFDKDEEHTWVIRADIPTGMKDYQVFELHDTLEDALTYVQGQTVNVQVVDKGTDTVVSGITLTKDTDYSITEPTGDGGKLDVVFTAAGIAKLAQAEGKQVKVEFNTTINDKAIMSKNIPNKVILNYGHDPNNKKEEKPGENPRVYTGGKRFVKVDSQNAETKLPGAVFVFKNADGKYLYLKDGKYDWKTVTSTKNEDLLADTTLVQKTSDSNGAFEIKGLKYERPNGTTYKAVEVKAPVVNDKEYVIPTNNEFEFTVNDTSYYTNASEITEGTAPGTADQQQISNMLVSIPQTGGIGSLIFIVAGLAIMGFAFVAMKKRNAVNA